MKRKSPGASPKEPDHGSDQPSPKRARQSSSPSDANTPSPPQASSLISSPLANPPRLGSGTSPLEQDVPDRALAEDSEAETEALSGAQDESRPQTPELDSQSSSAASSASPRADILEESVAPSPAPEPVDHPSPTPAPSVREAELVGKRPELNMRGQMDSVMTKGEEEGKSQPETLTQVYRLVAMHR